MPQPPGRPPIARIQLPRLQDPQHGRLYSADGDLLPSVTTVLRATQDAASRSRLLRWRAGLVRDMGESGFARQVADTVGRGVSLHAVRYSSSGGGDGNGTTPCSNANGAARIAS